MLIKYIKKQHIAVLRLFYWGLVFFIPIFSNLFHQKKIAELKCGFESVCMDFAIAFLPIEFIILSAIVLWPVSFWNIYLIVRGAFKNWKEKV